MRGITQVVEKNRFTAARIASESAAMNTISSPWLPLLAFTLALATIAPMAVVASRFI
jgi:hypothetical protein